MKISNDVQAVIYKKNNDDVLFLLLYRYNPDKNVNEYRLVKGGVKRNEFIEDAVKREIDEEVGLKDIEVISKVNEYNYIANDVQHNVDVFLVKAFDKNIVINSSKEGEFEIKEYKWEKAEKALNLLNFEDEKKSITNSFQKINLYNQ